MVGTKNDSATSALVSAMITDAEAEVDKFLSKRYDLSTAYFQTSTSTPPAIRMITETLALGYTYENMARGSKEAYMRSDRLIKRATDNLQSIMDGDMQLFDSAGNLIDETDVNWQIKNSTDYTPTFAEDDPKNWKVDPDKLDDISDERS